MDARTEGARAVALTGVRARAVLLCEGFAAVAVQLAAVRTLAPVAGVSVGTTSVVVCAFVAGLAAGYAAGGRVGPDGRLGVAPCLVAAGAVVGIGFVPAWYVPLGRWTAVAAAAALLAVAGALLGRCVVGVGVGAAGRGRRVGGAFGWSTAGNLAAALAVPFAVMRYGGVGWTTGLAAAALAVGGVVASGPSPGRGRFRVRAAAVAALAVAAGAWGTLHGEALRWAFVEPAAREAQAAWVAAGRPPPDERPGEARDIRAWAAAGGLPAGTVLAAGADAVRVGALRELRRGMRAGEAFAAVWRPFGRDGPALEDRLLANTVREVFALCEPVADARWQGLVCEASRVDGEVGAYVDARTAAEVDAGWRLSGEGASGGADAAAGGRGR